MCIGNETVVVVCKMYYYWWNKKDLQNSYKGDNLLYIWEGSGRIDIVIWMHYLDAN